MKKIDALLIFLVINLLMLSACAPTKGYPGPERPPEQLLIVTVDTDAADTDVDERKIDGIEFNSSGIALLPGSHTFSFVAALKARPYNCDVRTEFDDYSYDQCLRKEKNSNCNCFDYLSIYEVCDRDVRDASCDGAVSGGANEKREIKVFPQYGDAELRITDQLGRAVRTKADCSVYGQRTISEENYKGSGRSTAYAHGVTSCYSSY